jgi:hypothetical protein
MRVGGQIGCQMRPRQMRHSGTSPWGAATCAESPAFAVAQLLCKAMPMASRALVPRARSSRGRPALILRRNATLLKFLPEASRVFGFNDIFVSRMSYREDPVYRFLTCGPASTYPGNNVEAHAIRPSLLLVEWCNTHSLSAYLGFLLPHQWRECDFYNEATCIYTQGLESSFSSNEGDRTPEPGVVSQENRDFEQIATLCRWELQPSHAIDTCASHSKGTSWKQRNLAAVGSKHMQRVEMRTAVL